MMNLTKIKVYHYQAVIKPKAFQFVEKDPCLWNLGILNLGLNVSLGPPLASLSTTSSPTCLYLLYE